MALRGMIKLPLGVAVLGIGLGVAAANSAALKGLYQDVFPTDPAKRMALQLCFLQDHKFNRLDASAREACYNHALLVADTATVGEHPGQATAAVNFVDLKRAADLGPLPAHDIRLREQGERTTPH
jgi:hypothetical protein